MRDARRLMLALGGWAALASCAGLLPSADAHVELARDPVLVPLVFDEGVPLVDVWIDGRGPHLFKLDTGSGPCVVTDRLAERLQLPLQSVNGLLTGANGVTRKVGRVARLDTMGLGEGAALRDVRAFVLPAEDLDVHDIRRPVEGILGYAMFVQCTMVIDYRRRALELSRAPLPAADGREVLVMTVQSKTPRVTLSVAGRPMEVLIDTGNDQGLILTEEQGAGLPYVDAPSVGPLLSTVSGMVRVRLARLDADVAIGGHRVRRPVVSLMQCGGPMLGAELLSHFRVSLDGRGRRVRFERAQERPVTVDSRITDGLGLRRASQGWDVVDVIPDSPADREGVRMGDHVRQIDYIGRGRYRIEVGRGGDYREVRLRAAPLVR
ncbi:MAG: aspartyl protease family protein [Planctomycetota bacterium]